MIKNSKDNHFISITCASYNNVMLRFSLLVARVAQKCFLTHFAIYIFTFYQQLAWISLVFSRACDLLLKEQSDIRSLFSITKIYIILIHYFYKRHISLYIDVFSHDTFQNTPLTIGIQATTEPKIINKDITNRDRIATSSFPHGPSLKSHQNETIFLSSP